MIDLFMPFSAFLKVDNVCTDNHVFRLHYRVTVIMLLVFTLLVSTKQFFGEPIHCISDSSDNREAINNYCWIEGTYTVYSKNKAQQPYPGVGPEKKGHDPQVKHAYYQWVCFVLLGQAAMFYTPRYLWKIWEGGRLQALTTNLANPLISEEWTCSRRSQLVSYLSNTNYFYHNMYALRYAFCEILNLVNVVGQMFILDTFLDGVFRSYGSQVLSFYNTRNISHSNPMDKFFPKMTKCSFVKFGPSGNANSLDYLCLLPLNIVNEKIFVILWFWLIILCFLSLLAVCFRFMVFLIPPLRTQLIMGQVRYMKRSRVSVITRKFGFGDWYLLYLIGKNVNPIVYLELITDLTKPKSSEYINGDMA